MANPLRGEAPLAAGDASYTLCFDVNAFCYAEAQLAKTTDEIVFQVQDELSGWVVASKNPNALPRLNSSLVRGLLWAGLQKHHPGTHLVEAGEIMSDAGLANTVVAVTNAFFAAFGPPEAEGEKRPNPPKRKRGGRGIG